MKTRLKTELNDFHAKLCLHIDIDLQATLKALIMKYQHYQHWYKHEYYYQDWYSLYPDTQAKRCFQSQENDKAACQGGMWGLLQPVTQVSLLTAARC